MKKYALAIVGTLFSLSIFAQENLILRTDRDYYVGGEDMWLNIVNLNDETNQISDLSKVVYIELLNSDYKPVLQTKFKLINGQVTSIISLPDTISTANYALRCYTRWMRNTDEDDFVYKTISVINPFSKNALPKGELSEKVHDDHAEVKDVNSDNFVSTKLNSTVYKKRDRVKLDISNLQSNKYDFVTVSVVKSGLMYDDYHPQQIDAPEKKIDLIKGENTLLPEVEGELITGTITNLESGDVISDKRMILSFVSANPVMHFSETDSLGRFRFVVNEYGQREMVIQPFQTDTTFVNYKVNLDPSYSEDYPDKEMELLKVSKSKVEQLNKAIINMQINTIYSSYRQEGNGKDTIEAKPAFYGNPEINVTVDKFIELPTIEEVVKEIVPFVGLRKQKGEYVFKTFEPKSYYPRDGETLTLVDGIPVYNIHSVLAIDPEELDHIEVVNLDYYLSGEKLGRLLCFYTRDVNMGEMEFDNRIFRQARQCYHPSYTYVYPDYSSKEKRKNRLADFRNVLFFGNIDLTKAENELEFYTCDDDGEYTVIVEGIDSNGSVHRQLSSFVVR